MIIKVCKLAKYLLNNKQGLIETSLKNSLYLCTKPKFFGLTFIQKYNITSTDSTQYEELKSLSEILGIKYMQVNDQITYEGEVRLIDDKNKLIGIMTTGQAKQRASKLGQDLVMVNDSIKPAICKIYNYKESLYNRFIKEVIDKDPDMRKKKKQKSSKSIQLSSKISMGDLKNKAQFAADLSKKHGKIRLFMYVTDQKVDSAKNTLYTFKDLVKDKLTTIQEVKEVEIDPSNLQDDELKEEEMANKMLELEFQSIDFDNSSINSLQNYYAENFSLINTVMSYSEEEIKRLIKVYFSRKKFTGEDKQIIDEIEKDRDVASLKQEQENKQGHDLPIDQVIMQEDDLKNSKDYSAEYMESLKQFSKEQNLSYEDLVEHIEELKLKFNTDRSNAILQQAIESQNQKMKVLTRIMKLINKKNI